MTWGAWPLFVAACPGTGRWWRTARSKVYPHIKSAYLDGHDWSNRVEQGAVCQLITRPPVHVGTDRSGSGGRKFDYDFRYPSAGCQLGISCGR